MNRSIKNCIQDVPIDDNKNLVVLSKSIGLEFMKLSKENSVKNSILQTSNTVARLGWFCYN